MGYQFGILGGLEVRHDDVTVRLVLSLKGLGFMVMWGLVWG